MHNRIHLYVNRKHLTVWLMALCLLASSVVRITGYTGGSVGWGLILPVFATVLYGVIAMIFGQEMFYKTAIPIWLFGLSRTNGPTFAPSETSASMETTASSTQPLPTLLFSMRHPL